MARRIMLVLAVVCISFVSLGQAEAATLNWTSTGTGNQSWSTPGNWTPAGPPAASDLVYINITTANQTLVFTTGDDVSIDLKQLAGSGASTREFLLSGGTLTNNGSSVNQGNVTVTLDGGNYSSNKRYNLTDANAVLNIKSGSTFALTDQFGANGNKDATVNVYSGGTLKSPWLFPDMKLNLYSGATIDSGVETRLNGALNAYGGQIKGPVSIAQNSTMNVNGTLTSTASYWDSNRIGSRSTNSGQAPVLNMVSGSYQADQHLLMGYGFSATSGYTATLNLTGGTWSPTSPKNLYMCIDYDTPYWGQRAVVNQQGATSNFDTIYVGRGYRFDDPAGTASRPEGLPLGALLNITSGTLNANNIYLSNNATIKGRNSDLTMTGGTLNIANSLVLNQSYDSTYVNDVSITGGTIVFDSASFNIRSVDETANVVLTGGHFKFGSSVNTMEAPARDLGAFNLNNWLNNYALGTLELLPGASLSLADAINNITADALPEAVYVDTLILGNSSTLNLNNLNLYYKNITLGSGVQFPGGLPTQFTNPIPEPASLFLVVLGAAGLIRRRTQV